MKSSGLSRRSITPVELQFKRRLLERRERRERREVPEEDQALCPMCHRLGRYKDTDFRQLITCQGGVGVRRRYRRASRGYGFHPLDAAPTLADRRETAVPVRLWVAK